MAPRRLSVSHHNQPTTEWADRHRRALTTRHTHEDVLTDRQFEPLLEAGLDLPEPHDVEARFSCLAAGRLGLRADETAHFQTAWVKERMDAACGNRPPIRLICCPRGNTGGINHGGSIMVSFVIVV